MAQDWTSFSLDIAVKSTMQEMYDAWTQSGKIVNWFLATCTYMDNQREIDPSSPVQAGNTYEWTWYLYEEIEKGRFVQTNGTDFIQFTFAGECLVDIELSQRGEFVVIKLTHKNIPEDEKSKFNIRIGCMQGWTFYLANLKSVYETGYDLRNRDPELKGVNN